MSLLAHPLTRVLHLTLVCSGLALAACGDEPESCTCPDGGGCRQADAAEPDSGGQDAALPDSAQPDTAPRECESNPDCAAPTSVCDTIQGRCVECLVLSDCSARAGTVCSLGACVCPGSEESWCAASGCVNLQRSSEHCGSCGRACFGVCLDGTCADPWEPTATEDAPVARAEHVAVWTGSEMVVWGGSFGACDACTLNSGGIYDPAAHTWRATSTVGAPSARRWATAVWTGSEMLVWGGSHDGAAIGTGGRLDPAANTWQPISTVGAPAARYHHLAVWTGAEMIVLYGESPTERRVDGARYDPQTDLWTPIPPLSPARASATAAVLEGSLLIYGGIGNDGVDPDAIFPTANAVGGWTLDLGSDVWSPLPTMGQPSSRVYHTAAVAGDRMMIWGGVNGTTSLATGAVFRAGSWTATAPGPEARRLHTAVVLGDPPQVLVWGGYGSTGELSSGAAYDPLLDQWSTLPVAPPARFVHTAVSTGTSMIIWGGLRGGARLSDGAVYTPR